MLNKLTTPHEYPGKLFVVEGIDGSGKTTQLALLAKWLKSVGHPVFMTEWNSSALVKAASKTGKKQNSLTPMTFSLLHATDFADRLLYNIIPPLKAGMTVLADRYAYTAFARDSARGVDRRWVRELYSFGVRPDLAVYFRVPIEVSTDRLLARRVKLKFYEAGMDMGWSTQCGRELPDLPEQGARRVRPHRRRVRPECGERQRQHHRPAAHLPQAGVTAPANPHHRRRDRGAGVVARTRACVRGARRPRHRPSGALS